MSILGYPANYYTNLDITNQEVIVKSWRFSENFPYKVSEEKKKGFIITPFFSSQELWRKIEKTETIRGQGQRKNRHILAQELNTPILWDMGLVGR